LITVKIKDERKTAVTYYLTTDYDYGYHVNLFVKIMNYFVTGLLCSGKSTFLATAKAHDFETLSTDKLVTDLYKEKTIICKIQNEFRDHDLFHNTKEVIKLLFFKSDENRKKIESIIHPEVHKIIKNELQNKKNLIIELPPLLSNYELLKNNKSIFIDADRKVRNIRYLKRENKAEIDTFNRINDMQLNYIKLKMACDIIIDNNNVECFKKYFELEIIKS
jgi:dephospho-CoA kinase